MEAFDERETDRFWDMVAIRTKAECWHWLGFVQPNGYGKFRIKREGGYKSTIASRYSYEAINGPVPEGLVVIHTCGCRDCCNPLHLIVGNYQDRADSKRQRGVQPHGENHYNAKLSNAEVASVKRQLAAGCNPRFIAIRYGVDVSHIRNIGSGKYRSTD